MTLDRIRNYDAPPDAWHGALVVKILRIFFSLAGFYLRARVKLYPRNAVLYVGQAYYNAWYLSRGLRKRGWCADVLNWDTNPASQIYYHGEDFSFIGKSIIFQLWFYIKSLFRYDVFHFANAHAMVFGFPLNHWFKARFGEFYEIRLLKTLGKKIVYTNSGCMDGVSQTAFSKWSAVPICSICRWRNEPTVCSDDRNLAWGAFRNSMADFQCLLGGNRIDFNDDPRVHEAPEAYCLDADIWHPKLPIPPEFRLPNAVPETVRLYHAVGNKVERTTDDGINIKSSHVYLPLIKKLRAEGLPLELLEPTGIPNKELRFMQAQADIFLEMLSYGWFGANAREAMMLGKPVVCYIREEWLDSLRREIPEYAAELPVVSATPETIESVLRDLIGSPEKRRLIGERSRAFAVKWHSADAAGRRFNQIYTQLLRGDPLLRPHPSEIST